MNKELNMDILRSLPLKLSFMLLHLHTHKTVAETASNYEPSPPVN